MLPGLYPGLIFQVAGIEMWPSPLSKLVLVETTGLIPMMQLATIEILLFRAHKLRLTWTSDGYQRWTWSSLSLRRENAAASFSQLLCPRFRLLTMPKGHSRV